jgi:hypothetical protein
MGLPEGSGRPDRGLGSGPGDFIRKGGRGVAGSGRTAPGSLARRASPTASGPGGANLLLEKPEPYRLRDLGENLVSSEENGVPVQGALSHMRVWNRDREAHSQQVLTKLSDTDPVHQGRAMDHEVKRKIDEGRPLLPRPRSADQLGDDDGREHDRAVCQSVLEAGEPIS